MLIFCKCSAVCLFFFSPSVVFHAVCEAVVLNDVCQLSDWDSCHWRSPTAACFIIQTAEFSCMSCLIKPDLLCHYHRSCHGSFHHNCSHTVRSRFYSEELFNLLFLCQINAKY